MPMISVHVAATPSAQLSERLASTLTDLTASILHKDPAVTSVAITYVDPHQWFVAGERGAPTYFVEGRFTEGTNTKDEKAAYIAQVHAALDTLLGGVRPASYVQVAEVRADAYGYAGQTAERRYVAARLAAAPA
jgi:4-oxalocrotonate tautomerase